MMLENLYGKSESALIVKNNTQKFGVRSQPHNRPSIAGSSCAIVPKITGVSMSKMRTNLTGMLLLIFLMIKHITNECIK